MEFQHYFFSWGDCSIFLIFYVFGYGWLNRMWKLILIPLFIYTEISVRDANIEPNPFDHYLGAGVKNEYYDIKGYNERENGLYYRGGRVYIQPVKWVEVEHRCKEAKNIDWQSLRVKKEVLSDIYIGGSANTQSWGEAQPLGYVAYKTKNIKLSVETNLIRTIINAEMEYLVPWKGVLLGPYFEWSSVDEVRSFWLKLKLSWETKKRKGR